LAGRYEILVPLGQGGMGVVYKAHDRELDEIVALKLLRDDLPGAQQMARRFRSEIKLARRVRHRNVCGIHEFGQDGPHSFISMEYIAGIDYRKVLRDEGLTSVEAYEVAIQVAEGLQAIHEAGIVHRDLKTPNIMRDARGIVRLMDFGLAKQLDGTAVASGFTQTGMIVGTPEYMSPEQVRGENLDFRSDIYAFGIVVFELFTGEVPFRAETPLATILLHLQTPPPLDGEAAATIPKAAVPLLAKALAKAPGDRFVSAKEMGEALRAARSNQSPADRTESVDPTLSDRTTLMRTPARAETTCTRQA
jgi:serine/threonine protein kinase